MNQLKIKQRLPIGLNEAWNFFSSPANLKLITPPHMGFQIISGYHKNDQMYAGMIITYKVKPLLGIPITWVTEITHVREHHYFVDEQRFGPYAFWHHQHFFKEVEGGVEMTDLLHYKMPLGIIGAFANTLLTKRQIKAIFNYRYQKLEHLFGKWQEPAAQIL